MTRKRATRAAAWIAVAGVLSALTAGAASAAETAVGLTNANPSTLVTFPVGNPGAATPATINFPNVDGGILGPDTNLIGLDHRPRGGALYAQATRGTLYVLTPAAAAGQFNATAVNVTPFVSPFFSSFLNDFGFGFNPVADAIRVVEEENLNFRFSPNNGNSLGTDGNLNPGDPRIVAADYTNSFDGATSTTLYDIDSGSDRLFTQGSVGGAPVSPNTGNLIDVGPLGVDTTDNAGLDIAQASGTAYASFELAGSPGSSVLHRLNLSTGAATPVGTIAGGMPLESLSVVPASVLQFPSSATAVRKSSGQVQIPVTRTGPANRTATVAYSLSGGGGGMLTFAPGDYQENITVPTTGNVTITLSGESANAILGPQSSTSVVVVDDTAQTPQPSPGPGNDTTAPALVAKAGALKHGVLRVRFSCDEACFVRASVRLGGKTVGTATDSIGRAGTGKLRIRLNGGGPDGQAQQAHAAADGARPGRQHPLAVIAAALTQRACGRTLAPVVSRSYPARHQSRMRSSCGSYWTSGATLASNGSPSTSTVTLVPTATSGGTVASVTMRFRVKA